MIRSVVFDLDETLIDRNQTMRRFLATQQEQFPGLSGNFIDQCIQFQNNGYADKLEAYEKTCASIEVNTTELPLALFADFKARYGFEAIAFDGAVETLDKLSESCSLGIITNGRTRGQMAKIESTGLSKCLSAIVISESHGFKKPHVSIFEACLEQLGCEPYESVYIGDNPAYDIKPAKALGMHAIWMRNDHFAPPEACDGIAEGIREVPCIIARLDEQRDS